MKNHLNDAVDKMMVYLWNRVPELFLHNQVKEFAQATGLTERDATALFIRLLTLTSDTLAEVPNLLQAYGLKTLPNGAVISVLALTSKGTLFPVGSFSPSMSKPHLLTV